MKQRIIKVHYIGDFEIKTGKYGPYIIHNSKNCRLSNYINGKKRETRRTNRRRFE